MKIWVPLQGVVFFRNFISSGVLDSLAQNHKVIVSYTNDSLDTFPLPPYFQLGPKIAANQRRGFIRHHVQEFVMCGLRFRCRTFRLKLYRLSLRKRALYYLIANPFTAWLAQRVSEWYLGSDPMLNRVCRELSPDWVLIPSSCEDSLTADLVKAAKEANARSMIIVNGWDNLTSKGTLPVLPTRLGVWGPQAKEDAMSLHRMPQERIAELGAPQFENYFKPPETSKNTDNEIRQLNQIPANTSIILFAGCLQPFDETSVLRQLDQAIDRKEIPNAHVLYRPHPWRHTRDYEDHFKPEEFKHVSLDHQVGDLFLKVQKSRNTGESKKHFPDLNYYPKVIRSSEFVISPLSTFVLESLLMGKKTLAVCYSDGKHYFSADKVSQYEHVQCLQNAPGLLFSKDAKDLIKQCCELLQPTDAGDLYRRIHKHLRYVVFSDSCSYAERLASVLEGTVD